MTKSQERSFMDSFRGTPCESCGINDGSVVGAHFNMGMGGTGYRAKGMVAGLCSKPGGCHDILDRRCGTEEDRTKVLEKICQKLLRDRAYAFLADNAEGKS